MTTRSSLPAAFPRALVRGAALAGALAAAGALAGEIRETPIPVIEVIGKREGDVARQTGTVVIVTREDIELLAPLSNHDVLRRIPGVSTTAEEETAIVSNVGIRGLSASETKSLILEDGVPVAPGLFIGNERYFNPRIQRQERVEILKGSASLRYGPSTIGGVVNYLTKTPDDGALLSARVGSFGLRETTLEAGGRSTSGDAFGGLVATYATSDGFMDKAYEMKDVFVKGGMAIGSNQLLGVKISYHDNEADISYRGLLLGDFRAGATYNPAPDDQYLTDRRAFDVNHQWTISDDAQLSTVVYWSEVSRDYWRYDVDTPASNAAGRWVYRDTLTGNNRAFDRYGIETRLTLGHELFGRRSETEVGVRGMRESSDDRRIRATRAQPRTGSNDRHIEDSAESVAAYLQNRLMVTEQLAVTPGVRVESYRQQRKILTSGSASESTSNTEVLPGIGATYQVNPSAQFYGGVYRAFSPASNGVALDGLTDQKLEGERSDNVELGVRGTHGAFSYEVALFRMDFSNQVVTGNSDPNLSQSNAGRTLHEGAELVLGYALGGGFSIDGNLTYVPTSEFRSGDNRGNRIPYAPEWLANLGLQYANEAGLSVALLVHHTGSQFGDGANTRNIPTNAAGGIWGGRLDAYTLYDLTARYALNDRWSFFGAVKNLTDERYISGLRQGIYVGPERSFELGARVRL
jgi:Fe(3+) dicitrate transport protein